MLYSTLISMAALAGFTVASSAGGMQIVVKNQCSYDLNVSKLTNKESTGTNDMVAQGSSKTYDLPENWQGRFFGQTGCSGNSCKIAGGKNPASLAEFTFRGAGGNDFYDLSFVDGFNLPIEIVPINGKGGASGSDKYNCGKPSCSNIPTCPDDMKITSNGKFVGCQSACSRYGTDEYCCTGSHSTPETCSPNSYSKAVKDDCPSAYSYAYDDKTSTYSCVAEGYNVVFCP